MLLLAGCGSSDVGNAPVVKITAEQRTKDLDAKAAQTLGWLEKMPADQRQGMVERTPQIRSALKDASDPALKQRIAALGVNLDAAPTKK